MTNYRSVVSLTSILLASILGVIAAPAVAAPSDCGPPGMRGDFWEYRVERMAQHHKMLHDALKLTPGQEGAWKKLMDSEHPMARPEPGVAHA
jgi:protein CpxP